MSKFKLSADGFHEDAESLLEEFSKKDCMHFSSFAEVWKARGFSSMFMGFDDEDELREFTEEIFLVASKFVAVTCPNRQVGGIYLLYALYRHQTLNPPVKIRLVLDQMVTITKLCDSLSFEDHKTFHYVASYLAKNSFDLVACPRPMGPNMSAKLTEDLKRECKDNLYSFQVDLKKDMTELAQSGFLKKIGDMLAEYSETRKASPGVEFDVAGPLLGFTSRLESMLGTSSVRARKSTSSHASDREKSTSIGPRRVDLKMKAFGVPARHQRGIYSSLPMEDEDESDDDWRVVPPKRRPSRKRRPKKVGRPKKEDIKAESDDDLDAVVQKSTVAKANRKPSRITRYHYSRGEDLQKISYYDNLKFGSNHASCQLFSDSEVDDPEPSATEFAGDTNETVVGKVETVYTESCSE
ncbi:hypothetical protein JTE90_023866 [Oedothorax gibbosus]|uniref:snRNA-activating protein complex subunit 1 n=1 Tax=Oedothorax gibbosus TaxID=931172 RepID=A0AAV6ULA9_9ARAC|nr:hypothetical protein JTE90_023866 [Oedothorax gibbosus]